jgi:hypothetical protein
MTNQLPAVLLMIAVGKRLIVTSLALARTWLGRLGRLVGSP